MADFGLNFKTEVAGKSTASANGVNTDFQITHNVNNVSSADSYCYLDCSSHRIARSWTIDATKIYITFETPPANSTTVVIYWRIIP